MEGANVNAVLHTARASVCLERSSRNLPTEAAVVYSKEAYLLRRHAGHTQTGQ